MCVHQVVELADEQRMVDAMNIFVVACMQRVTSPFNSFDPAMFGSKAQVGAPTKHDGGEINEASK